MLHTKEQLQVSKLLAKVHTSDRKTVNPTSRCSASNGVLHCFKSVIAVEATLRSLEAIICCWLLKLSHLNIIHQKFLVLFTESVCLGAGVTVFYVRCVSFYLFFLTEIARETKQTSNVYYHCDNYVAKRKTFRKNNSDITVIWVSDWFKWANLFK